MTLFGKFKNRDRFLRKLLFVLTFWAGLLTGVAGFACDFCMLGQGVSPYLTASGRGLTLEAQLIEADHIYNRALEVDSSGKKESWVIYTLTGFYPVNDSLSVMFALPYVSKTNIDFDEASNLNTGTLTSGVGDASLTGRYTLFNLHTMETTWVFGLLGGVKFPTGTTNNRAVDLEPIDRHGLPGTGSFDLNLGFTTSYATASGLQLTGDLGFGLAGPGKWAERDHQYGNSLNYSVKGFYRVWPEQAGGKAIMPYVGGSGEWTGMEEGATDLTGAYDPKARNLSSGGTVLYGDFGLYSVLSAETYVNLSFSKAFYHHMNFDPDFEADPAENYKLRMGITYLF